MTTNQKDADTWHTVDINNTYNDPVVVMGPVSNYAQDPITVRVRNVRRTATGKTSFEW